VVLDVNEMAKGQVFMTVNEICSEPGRESAGVFVRQYRVPAIYAGGEGLRTGRTLEDHAERVGSVVWANDNKTIFLYARRCGGEAAVSAVPAHGGDGGGGCAGL